MPYDRYFLTPFFSFPLYILSPFHTISTSTNLFPSSFPLIVLGAVQLVSILKSEANRRDNRARQDTTRAPLDVANDTFNPVNSCNYSNYL